MGHAVQQPYMKWQAEGSGVLKGSSGGLYVRLDDAGANPDKNKRQIEGARGW